MQFQIWLIRAIVNASNNKYVQVFYTRLAIVNASNNIAHQYFELVKNFMLQFKISLVAPSSMTSNINLQPRSSKEFNKHSRDKASEYNIRIQRTLWRKLTSIIVLATQKPILFAGILLTVKFYILFLNINVVLF